MALVLLLVCVSRAHGSCHLNVSNEASGTQESNVIAFFIMKRLIEKKNKENTDKIHWKCAEAQY